jgi:hypothetical protein
MLNVGLQLAAWFPVVVMPLVTTVFESMATLVYSVTPTVPLTIVASPDEYPIVLAVKVSLAETRFVKIALVVQVLFLPVLRRVSVTVTAPNCTVTVVVSSGDSMFGNDPVNGTFTDSPSTKGLIISCSEVTPPACADDAAGKNDTNEAKITAIREFLVFKENIEHQISFSYKRDRKARGFAQFNAMLNKRFSNRLKE